MKRWIVIGLAALTACLPGCSRGLARGCYKGYEFEPYPSELVRITVTQEQAIELAEEYGLAEGIAPWRVLLCGNDWCVENTLYSKDSSERGGNTMMIDGLTGKLLGTMGWAEIP